MSSRKHELRRLYDLTAQVYNRRYGKIQRQKYRDVFENLGKADRVLDLGCGTGMLLRRLRKKAGLLVGVDISPEMLAAAKRDAGEASLILADADHLPFANGSFDVVVSVTLLQNMPDPAKTVCEIARVLRPNGRAIITSLGRKHSSKKLVAWAVAAKLKPLKVGEIPGSEDVICVARREG